MKLILQILLILTIITTVSICAIKPELHKNVMVYDSAYTPVTEEEVTTETVNIPVMEVTTKPVQKTIKTEQTHETTSVTKNTPQVNVKKNTQTIPKQTTAKKQTTTKPVIQTVKAKETVATVKPNVTQTKQEEAVKKITTTVTPVKEVKEVNTMTTQEETIAWNIWRSNLTNKIMQDTKLPDIPNGTLFHFSFNVDKFGKISNVQTGANPANYTPYAIQYIAPVIRSYQGHSILNFPEGTARTSTTVTGKWRISNTERFSSPQDYNDIERVTKY